MFFVDRAHQRRSRRKDLVDEDEDGLLWRELDSLPNNVDELADGEILGNGYGSGSANGADALIGAADLRMGQGISSCRWSRYLISPVSHK